MPACVAPEPLTVMLPPTVVTLVTPVKYTAFSVPAVAPLSNTLPVVVVMLPPPMCKAW